MGSEEWVRVKATLLGYDDKKFRCADCLAEFRDRPELGAKAREVKACETVRETPIRNIDREIFFYTCPGNFADPSLGYWLEAHRHFERGLLPFPGSLMDQPAKAVELFRMLDVYKQDKIKASQAMERARARRGG